MRIKQIIWFLLIFISFPSMTFAHPLTEAGVVSGLLHPLFGADHFLAALAVGLAMSKQKSGRLILPATFLLGMVMGCVIGFSNFGLSFTETGILISIGVLGLVLFSYSILPFYLSIPMLLMFGFFHGNAHGFELQKNESLLFTISGLIISTLFIHILGYGFVQNMKSWLQNHVIESFIKVCGLVFLLSLTVI